VTSQPSLEELYLLGHHLLRVRWYCFRSARNPPRVLHWKAPNEIRALQGYGKEDGKSTENRNRWTFGESPRERALRAEICQSYWPTVHIDLRMVDKSDFLISFCPTNIYCVGSVHEIALARQQHKPVLFVSPPIPLRSLTSSATIS
jgi:hypothetical protein